MKKCFLIVTAVLLAVMLAGCNNIVKPETAVSGKGVKIAIEGANGSARSLTQGWAESDMDYIEVIFMKTKDDSAITFPIITTGTGSTLLSNLEIYREAWMLNNIGTIGIPDEFDVAKSSCLPIVFGGLKDGKILLAVGKISKVNNTAFVEGTTSKLEVKNGDTVTFKMVALTSSVTDTATSSFQILTTGTSTTATDPGYIAKTASIAAGDFPTLLYRNQAIPVYRVANSTEAGSTAITASYTFGFSEKNPIAGGLPIPVSTFADYGKYIRRKQDDPTIRTMGTTLENGYTKAALTVDITTSFADGAALPSTLAFTLTTYDSGLCTIFFRIPVFMCGIDESTTEWGETVKHTKWYVQSGLDNSVLDTGTVNRIGEPVVANGSGGSILLGIGNDYNYKEKDRGEVIINW